MLIFNILRTQWPGDPPLEHNSSFCDTTLTTVSLSDRKKGAGAEGVTDRGGLIDLSKVLGEQTSDGVIGVSVGAWR